MTIDELAARMDEKFAGIDEKFAGIDQKFGGIDQKLAGIDQKFAGIDQRFDRIDQRFDRIDQRFEALEKNVDEGFNASRARDEELRDLTKFGLEAREILRDEMHRRFDAADRKHDEAISLLETAVRDSSRRK
jgi:septation ring formation regulator EzrA